MLRFVFGKISTSCNLSSNYSSFQLAYLVCAVMEKLTVSKLQAVKLAKGIVEARDEELAFLLQLQEIVKSTRLPDRDDLEESPLPPLLIGIALKDSQIAADKDKGVALTLAADELGSLVVETEESQLSLLEADRLAHLDAIQEHDAQFARSIANAPRKDWEETGNWMKDPFDAPNAPNEVFAYNEVDRQFDSVLSQLEDASIFPRKRSRDCGSGVGKNLLIIRRLPTAVKLHEMHQGDVLHSQQQQEKGKKVLQEDDDDSLSSSPLSVGSPSKNARRPSLTVNLEHKDGDAANQTDDPVDDGECGQTTCQICFDATLTTSPSVSLEGCGHKFCETCLPRHAEARILDGHMEITCPHVECRTIISFTQLSFLLNSTMLEVLSRRQIEAAIPESERLYCPFKDCSALLCKPSPHVQQSSSSAHPYPTPFGCVECDACHRAICLECEVAWHADMSCAKYKATLEKRRLLGDEKLLQLANKEKWQRCKCGRVVELAYGCHHMSCLCGHSFCYICGAPWLTKELKPCTCPRWNESKL